LTEESKNLTEVTRQETAPREGTKPDLASIKGKIVAFAWKLKTDGYRDTTIREYVVELGTLLRKGADLSNPLSVKETIAKEPLQDTTKRNYANAYQAFMETLGLTWKKPRYKPQEKFPFIPLESDIDQLVSGTGKKLGTALQTAKETGMRVGEILRLKWTDIQPEQSLIMINDPEKGSAAGAYKVSAQLISRIMALPKTSERIFPTTVNSITARLRQARKSLAQKLGNPRLQRITFHTLRHWKGTMLYHKTRDPLYVQQFLRHKSIKNTMIYINIERTLFQSGTDDEFHVKTAETLNEACELLKVGFEYVTDMENVKIFKKRK
jgi:integrase/recombinase XerD